MSDLTRYPLSEFQKEVLWKHSTVPEPDDSLQQIADAWRRFGGDTSKGKFDELRPLLDGLVNGADAP